MHNEYRFVDRWFVCAPLEATYDVVAMQRGERGVNALFAHREPRFEGTGIA